MDLAASLKAINVYVVHKSMRLSSPDLIGTFSYQLSFCIYRYTGLVVAHKHCVPCAIRPHDIEFMPPISRNGSAFEYKFDIFYVTHR
jgi:hypothetical protein